jgi:hypothetical protein
VSIIVVVFSLASLYLQINRSPNAERFAAKGGPLDRRVGRAAMIGRCLMRMCSGWAMSPLL